MLFYEIFLSSPASSAVVGGVATGLILHSIYHRYEPTLGIYLAELVLTALVASFYFVQISKDVYTSVWSSSVFVAVHLATLGTSIAIYRLFFHPLKKYPGPFFAKLTKFRGMLWSSTGQFHRIIPELHQKYGDIVRIGPDELSFANPSTVKDIHGAGSMKLGKGPFYDTRLWAAGVSLGDTRDIPAHRWRRRIWDKGLNTQALVSYEPRIMRILDQVCEEFAANEEKEVDMGRWVDYFAFDTMGDLAFNESFNFVKTGKVDELREFVRKGLKLTHIIGNIPWLVPWFSAVPMDKDTKTKLTNFVNISADMYGKRRALGVNPGDLFSYLLKKDEKSGILLSEVDLAADSPVIIVAGSDTTSVCLSFVLYYITRDPSIQQKLMDEIDQAYENHENPLVGNKLSDADMPYLNGVINESLRMVAPAPNGNQRTTPKGGHVIDGEYFPPGIQVHVSPATMHRDPRNFTEPDIFVPERWIEGKRDPAWQHEIKAFIPFSAGQYVCPGKALALLEMRLFLVRILRDWKLEMSGNFDHEKFWLSLYSYMGYVKGPMPLTIRKRNRRAIDA